MNAHSLNTFIINNDPSTIREIRLHLQRRFGNILNISAFRTGQNALKELNKDTRIVILDNCLAGENEAEVKRSIKLKNPDTEVIMLTSREEIASAINNYCELKPGSAVKRKLMWSRLSRKIYKIVSYPIHLLVREFGVSKFVAIFLLAWLTIGIIAIISLKLYF